jgi:hypothetical protein
MRRLNLVLGGILALTLFMAYQIWTEEASPVLTSGDFTIWRGEVSQVDSITYTFRRGHTRIERRTDPQWGEYFWGAASSSDPDTLNFVPSPGFLVGVDGRPLVASLANLMAVREFGELGEDALEEYGFSSDSTATLRVYFRDGAREVAVGGVSHGSSDRYALDPATGRAFVLANEVFNLLEGGARFLQERRLHVYSPEDVRTARLTSPGGELALVRNVGQYGAANWSLELEPEAVNPALTNFMDLYNSLWYSDITKVAQRELLESVARVDYFGGDGRQLGYLELYRWDGPGGTPLYYLETEVTRSPVEVPFLDTPRAIEKELPTLF